MRSTVLLSVVLVLGGAVHAAPRQHVIVLGRWRAVDVHLESGKTHPMKVQELSVDGRVREYTSGPPHEVTERLFVVRRAYRMNDALPDDSRKAPQWVWRLGGWISVDRQTGHVAQLNLPAFDGEASLASWYRDYAAYCGVSDDGSRNFMMVAQLGKKKPLLRKEIAGAACMAPRWERAPSRVTFFVGGEKSTFVIRANGADLQPEPVEEEGSQ